MFLPFFVYLWLFAFENVILFFVTGKAIEDCYVIAKYDYVAQGTQELSLRKNEKLLLLDDSKHWWRVQNSRNQSGYVPSNYVKKEKPSIFDSIKKKVKKGSSFTSRTLPSSTGGSPVREFESPAAVRRPQPFSNSQHQSHDLNTHTNSAGVEGQGWAAVRYNYVAQQPDELPLIKGTLLFVTNISPLSLTNIPLSGTRVLVLEKSSDGWWRGQYENQIGWFPSNYTTPDSLQQQQQQQQQPSMMAGMAPLPAASAMVMSTGEHMYSAAENVLDVMVALYRFVNQLPATESVPISCYSSHTHSFAAQSNEELSFVKGERLEILDRPPADPDWYRARNAVGSIGLIPKNYVQVNQETLRADPFFAEVKK